MDGVQISYELAVPLDQVPAATPFETGADLVHLLCIVGGLEQSQDDKPRKVDWRLAKSMDGATTLRSQSEPDVARRAALRVVRGFGDAEEFEQLPPA